MSSVGPRCAGSQSPAGPLLQHAREDFSGTVTAKLPLTAQRFLAQELELFSLARASEKALLHLQSHPGATQELKFHKNNHFAPPPSHQPLHPHPAGTAPPAWKRHHVPPAAQGPGRGPSAPRVSSPGSCHDMCGHWVLSPPVRAVPVPQAFLGHSDYRQLSLLPAPSCLLSAGPRGGGEGGTEVLKWSLHLLPRLHAGTATCRFWLSDSAPGVRPGPDRGTGLLRAQVTQTQYIGALAASKSGQFA
ncbi:uncharacterized protein LOC142068195 isoform X1 [Phalacrocorax aristotelis]|uniref:uncharacterized protein LOC142068195 isoform X1 n=1 Tax=Phalacrocorax aristotelis TaxID=126867 RepID=UPI003F4C6A05